MAVRPWTVVESRHPGFFDIMLKFFDGLPGDVRYAARSLLRTPAFTAAAVLTLALGIGANTAIFSAVNAVLLRPLPFPDADRLVVVWTVNEQEGIDRDISSFPVFADLRQQSRTLAGLAAYSRTAAAITEGDEPEQVSGANVTGDFFHVLGRPAALGRVIGQTDMEAGQHQVVVLSHDIWARHFGGDVSVIGRTARIGGIPREVIGVMPPGFGYPDGAGFWMPLARTEAMAGLMDSRGMYWLSIIGRLAPGVPLARATAELDGAMRRMVTEYPETMAPGTGAFIEPLRDTMVGELRPALLLLLGAVGFVLLIACANMANLLLARGAARQKEMAVRSALGAGGGRLIRQVLTESVVLAVFGGAAGVLLAVWGTAALVAASPADMPLIDSVRIDGVVLGVAALIALATGLLFGLAPALQARDTALSAVLREGGRSGAGDRVAKVRPLLIGVQVALALMLLIGAGLLMRSFAALQSVDPGFRTENVLSFRLTLPAARYEGAAQVNAFRSELAARLEGMPTVDAVRGINTLFLQRLPNMAPITVEGRASVATGEQAASVTQDLVDPGFFAVMDVPIVLGRPFGTDDVRGGVTTVVVNETFVRRYFPGENPLGRRFTWGNPGNEDAEWLTIIGVAADMRRAGLAAPVRPEAYRSTVQVPSRTMEYLVATTSPPLNLVPELRSLLRQMDADLPLVQLRTVDEALADMLATRRFIMVLLGGFAAVALALAAVGIYGVLSFLVGQRTREMGVRMALGATRRDVLVLVLRDAMKSVVPGLAAGIIGALLLTRLVSTQLFGVTATDPLTFAAVTSLLLGVALLASWLPAQRAANVPPSDTLKQD
jgi:putative ABC transport system permease protein